MIEPINPSNLPSLAFDHKQDLPTVACVYFVIENETILYIGQTKNLRKRWKHHNLTSKLKNRTDIKIAWFEVAEKHLKRTEKIYINRFNPHYNIRDKTERVGELIFLDLEIPIDIYKRLSLWSNLQGITQDDMAGIILEKFIDETNDTYLAVQKIIM